MKVPNYERILSGYPCELSPQELLGQQLKHLYGRNLNYAEYIYLTHHPDCQDLEHLKRASSLREQDEIRRHYVRYRSNGLTEEDFFPEGEDVIAEKLLRYVDIPAHKHNFLEFSYVISGECIHEINGNRFIQSAGSFVFIPTGIVHVLTPIDDGLCLTIKIRTAAFLKMDLPEIVNFIYPLAFHCSDDSTVLYALLQLLHQQGESKIFHSRIIFYIFQTVLLYIIQNYLNEASVLTLRSKRDSQLIKLLNYTATHYSTVTLAELADVFHYNPSYLSRMFREETGQSFSEVLKDYKLRKAAELLSDTRMSLENVCAEIGYRDVTQFIRSFKAMYGSTPGRYRQKNKS